MKLILASASPRRAEIMRSAGFIFETIPADVDETRKGGEAPADYVRRLADGKARAAAKKIADLKTQIDANRDLSTSLAFD